MPYSLMPHPRTQFFDANGAPLAGGKVYTYEPGTSTPKATYTDSTGGTPNTNPVILDSRGEASIWLNGFYKIVLKDSGDNTVWTVDQVSSMPATTTTVMSEWLVTGDTPTYVSATSFTVPGDQTSVYQVGRRVRCAVTAGTVYGVITASAYTTLTTVTVALDSGSLDAGLSVVDVSLLSASFPAIPKINLTIPDATALPHAATAKQVQNGSLYYAADTGTAKDLGRLAYETVKIPYGVAETAARSLCRPQVQCP